MTARIMIPIHALLNRILWDPEFAQSEFVIGYYDRIEERIIKVPFKALHFSPNDHFAFQVVDCDDEVHTVPFHRVKEIYKDGRLIWYRRR